MTAILGISAFYHDSAAALVVDGEIVAAAQEERFTRNKHDDQFPSNAIEYCLGQAELTPEDLDFVGFYDKPIRKFDRLLETYLAFVPSGFKSFRKAMPLWLKEKLHLPRQMNKGLKGRYKGDYIFTEHHESHAASAFFPSPFDEAAILTMDGVGEWATTTMGVGRGNKIELTHELRFPHSLGLLYSAFTYYCGFKVNGGEYKLMGLAPYGRPVFEDLILERLLDLKEDGSFRMDMSYFNYCQGLTMTSHKFHRLFGGPPRKCESTIEQRDMDIAASVQKVTERIMLASARHLHAQTGLKNLCLAGGVALNCVGNGRIQREGPFENIWIQPAAGDAGGALGVAQFIWHQLLNQPRVAPANQGSDRQHGSLLGVEYSDDEIESFLKSVDGVYDRIDDEETLCDVVADSLADGKVIGWFQGRMEFGPRALGSRSILGDARNPQMQSIMNVKVKFREGFRPFAPIVLQEHASEYFELKPGQESPYMLMVAPVRDEKRLSIPTEQSALNGLDLLKQERSIIPAVTHVDYSARVQTIDRERHGLLRKLLEKFHDKTDCPVLINTSFNLGWDPIVCTPRQAYQTFMASDIDVLCMGRFVLTKQQQPATKAIVTGAFENVLSDKFRSPCVVADNAELTRSNGKLVCRSTGREFEITDNIPQLFWPHDEFATDGDAAVIVKGVYENTPFPNYDDHDSLRSLIEKSRNSNYACRLDQAIPYNSDVLEVGCGTGQLSNFLGISCRNVIGADICLNSLRLGEQFRQKHGLSRVQFVQMNLFHPPFNNEQFDVVLCHGVLHHTADPYGGFQQLTKLVKPGGHIIIGLYHKYGRLMTDMRRKLFRLTGGRAKWIDPILRRAGASQEKRRAWFEDQYRHPHESKHTLGEVLEWFENNGLSFVRGIPSLRLSDDGLEGESLFEPQSSGTKIDRFFSQAAQFLSIGQGEDRFFIMIGRKPSRSVAAAKSDKPRESEHREESRSKRRKVVAA